ncbi:MAG: hypothetical protein HY900_34035 [Deltaproteobacteria bacterium]|nr:hypothetical protein [Deltaproteobacteria bacterium]
MTPRRRALRLLLPFLTALLALTPHPSAADERHDLLSAYSRLQERLDRNAFGIPLHVESTENGRSVSADAYGVFDHPFESVLESLAEPSNWPDIATLHPNVKASTYARGSGDCLLTFYCGRKFYQSPETAHRLTFRYQTAERRRDYVKILLDAETGPYGTKEHRMKFEAAPLDAHRTLVHVSYGYGYGASLRLAEKVYFATLGRDKIGFTVTGTDPQGNPVYIGGSRGAIERNAVRYYFAIQSFLNTLRYPEEKRFALRVGEWYDLTQKFKKQLYEVERDEYLKQKAKERRHQEALQGQVSTLTRAAGGAGG